MSDFAPTAPVGLGAWMRLLRISNAPTVITGSLVGAAIGGSTMPGSTIAVLPMTLVAAGTMLLYMGGMVMNDYFDQPIDRRERPSRPIVSGQIRESSALLLAMTLIATAVLLLAAASSNAIPWMLLLVSCVTGYNLLHRSAIAGPALMACCRALVPTIAAIACSNNQQPDWNLLGFFALPLGVYTLGISIAARNEAAAVPVHDHDMHLSVAASMVAVAAVLPFGAVACRLLPALGAMQSAFYAAAMLGAAWLLFRGLGSMTLPGGVPRGVMRWIAGIACIDTASLVMLGRGELAAIAAIACIATLLLQRRILGS
jgi:4-hydroxybenzoate polyprenyltransferase